MLGKKKAENRLRINMSANTAKELPLFFDAKEAGASLEEVAVDHVQSEGEDLTSYWYHSPLDVDLYVWVDKKKNIIKQQVSICGQICEWNIVDGVKTGFVFETEIENNDDETTITYDQSVQKTSLRQTMQFIAAVEVLPSIMKKSLITNYEKNPRVDSIDPAELLARYGDKASDAKCFLAKFIKKLFK